MINKNLRRTLGERFSEKQNKIWTRSGVLGDGNGNVIVPSIDNYVYVQTSGGVEIIFNNRVQAEDGLLVTVGYDPTQPDLYQVLSTRTSAPGGTTGSASVGYAPAIRYQWGAVGGGQDPLWVEKRQYMPGRVGMTTGMVIEVQPDTVWSGSACVASVYQTVDLTSAIPSTSGKAAAVLITLDTTGAVVATKGTEVNFADLVDTDAPAPPTGTAKILGAVRVYNGQTEVQDTVINNTDILDWRDSGWGGWSAMSLSDLTDVAITTPTNGQALMWNTDHWENAAIPVREVAQDDDGAILTDDDGNILYVEVID